MTHALRNLTTDFCDLIAEEAVMTKGWLNCTMERASAVPHTESEAA